MAASRAPQPTFAAHLWKDVFVFLGFFCFFPSKKIQKNAALLRNSGVPILTMQLGALLNSSGMEWTRAVSLNKLRFTDLPRHLIPPDIGLMIKDLTPQTFKICHM